MGVWGAGGSERRDEGVLGRAPASRVSPDNRSAGGGKAALVRRILRGAILLLVARNVGPAGAIHRNRICVRVRVSAQKRGVDKARSGGIELGHKCGNVGGIAARSEEG